MEKNGNRFMAHSTAVDSNQQVRRSIIKIMRINGVPSATQNGLAYHFEAPTGPFIKVSMTTGRIAGRQLLRTLAEK